MSPAPSLSRADIGSLIPHQGAMCLIGWVDGWDERSIVCRADNHRDARHPLRTRRGLLSTCLIEYAAQAAAVHGALQVPSSLRADQPGFLAAVRHAEFAQLNLDQLPPADPDYLRIEAQREAGDERQLRYAFSAHHAGKLLASGRLTVVLNAPPPGP